MNQDGERDGVNESAAAASAADDPWREVKRGYLQPDRPLPLVVEPAAEGVDLREWARRRREHVEDALARHGAILFRGFGVNSAEEFERFIGAVSTELMEYRERTSPRSQVSGKIYTSTDYPASQSIFPHNEHSYSRTFPMKIFFFCQTAAREGGETPIGDCRKVFRRLDPDITRRFAEKKWMYVRNFGDGFGLPWQVVFQTSDKSEVEAYCRKAEITCEWKDDDRLRTKQVRPAVARHPQTGEMVWFNHAAFFHVTTLDPALREGLLAEFDEEDLPNNTFYGDGTPIEPEVLERIRAAYLEEMVAFPWRRGDILMLNNMLTAHARRPFAGQRKVLVGMSDPFTRQDF
jgi:alpha-ketoglutarate-dependent taurine dioxygenase